jgi:hypothetical protein
MKIGPFSFWVISPFAGVQLWSYYCVLNPSGLPAIAIELSCSAVQAVVPPCDFAASRN